MLLRISYQKSNYHLSSLFYAFKIIYHQKEQRLFIQVPSHNGLHCELSPYTIIEYTGIRDEVYSSDKRILFAWNLSLTGLSFLFDFHFIHPTNISSRGDYRNVITKLFYQSTFSFVMISNEITIGSNSFELIQITVPT